MPALKVGLIVCGRIAQFLLPMVALFRIAKQGSSADGGDVMAGALPAITMLAILAPGGLYLFPPPWNMVYVAGQVFVWTLVLVFLLNWARREKKRAGWLKFFGNLVAVRFSHIELSMRLRESQYVAKRTLSARQGSQSTMAWT